MNYLRKTDIYRLCAHGAEDEAMSQLFDVIDALYYNAEWDAVDGFLNDLDPSKLTPVVIVLILTLTYPAKQHLRERDGFVNKAEAHLIEELGRDRALDLVEKRR